MPSIIPTEQIISLGESFAPRLKADLADNVPPASKNVPLANAAFDLGLALNVAKVAANSPTGRVKDATNDSFEASVTEIMFELSASSEGQLEIRRILELMEHMGWRLEPPKLPTQAAA